MAAESTSATVNDSEKDDLLPIARRKCFDRDLPEAVSQCAQNGHPCSLLMLDIDRFKTFNDNYGHQTGDEVLIAVASTVAATIALKGIKVRRRMLLVG